MMDAHVGDDNYHRLNILDVQRLIRFMPKVIIAVVPGWAVGGGHSLHVVCDLTLASAEHAIFKQTDADVTSFDGGYGYAYLEKMVGQKKAREIFFLGRNYSAQEAFEMGMVNQVIPHEKLEDTAYEWAQEILEKSPTSIKMLKFAMNLTDDGMVGQQVFAGEATRLAYMTDEAKEGLNSFLEKRKELIKKYHPYTDGKSSHRMIKAVKKYQDDYQKYFKRNHKYNVKANMLDPYPRLILVKGIGIFSTGPSFKDAKIAMDVGINSLSVILEATKFGEFRSIPEKEIFKMEYWPLELAKIKPSTHKLKGHVTVITGGLGAIGYSTAKKFLQEGSEVVLLDIIDPKNISLNVCFNLLW